MSIYPPIAFTLPNGFLLIIPLLALRYGIPALIRRDALAELDFFAPVAGAEQIALKAYFVTNTFLVFSPLLARIEVGTAVSFIGWAIYGLGLVLLAISLVEFSATEGLVRRGVYRFSRNPICTGYLLIYLGVSFLIGSWFHLVLTAFYQLSVHWLILSEERWCQETFGDPFAEYQSEVPRYL